MPSDVALVALLLEGLIADRKLGPDLDLLLLGQVFGAVVCEDI